MKEDLLLTEKGYLLAREIIRCLKMEFGEKEIAVVKRVKIEEFIGKKLDPRTMSNLFQTFKTIFGIKVTSEMTCENDEQLTFVCIKPDAKRFLELQELREKRNAAPIIVA